MSVYPNAPYWPNPLPANVAPNGTSWVVVASDGTTYSTVAALLAAGKRPYPGLDPGGRIGSCLLHSISSTGGAGSGFLYKRDTTTAPSAVSDAENTVAGSDQQVSVACPFRLIWVKNVSGTDRIILDGRY